MNWTIIVADVDECSSNPCSNDGVCRNFINEYTCQCAPGYEGAQCETGKRSDTA